MPPAIAARNRTTNVRIETHSRSGMPDQKPSIPAMHVTKLLNRVACNRQFKARAARQSCRP
jgi:hypothetical protein